MEDPPWKRIKTTTLPNIIFRPHKFFIILSQLSYSVLRFLQVLQISTFYCTHLISWCLEKELPFVPARYIRTFKVVYEVIVFY